MEKIGKLIILVCIFTGCIEEQKPLKPFFENMTLSNSLPVQFWVNGQETFNEKDVCGMTSVCWCQPFQCDDEIRLQVIDYYLEVANYLELQIFDSNDTLLESIQFEYTSLDNGPIGLYNRWDLSFRLEDYDICDKQVYFKINSVELVAVTTEVPVYEFNFDSDMDGWFNTVDGINPDSTSPPIWAHSTDDGGSIIMSQGTSMSTAFAIIRKSGISLPAETSFIRFKYRINYPPNNAGLKLDFSILDASNAYAPGYPAPLLPAPSDNSLQTVIFSVVSSSVWSVADAFLLSVSATSLPVDNLDVIHIDEIKVYTETYEYEPVRTEIAKSDCVSIKESHPCTVLINYSNNSDFDGIQYANQSPNLDFNLRIPAIFFEEQNTKESEDIELSSDEIVRLYDKIEEKRELRVGFMPHYMHRKLLLALSHDFVIIDEKDWLLRDEYKKNEGNRHYPLRTASVLLTDKNFIKENQL